MTMFSTQMEKQKLQKTLELLPTLEIQLNYDQLKILNSTDNMFVLGRSGTGKTTTTILRIFCQEILLIAVKKQKKLMDQYERTRALELLQKVKKVMPRLEAKDLQNESQIRMVFATASPVLTNEVK